MSSVDARRRGLRTPTALGLLVTFLILIGWAPAALAHDELTGTEPASGETLQQPPAELTLTFSGELTDLGAWVEVSGPLGSALDGTPEIEGDRLSQPLSTDVPSGDYEATWRVTSQDGHPISGTFDYTVQEPASQGTQPLEARADAAPRGGQASPTTVAPAQEGDPPASTDAVASQSGDTEAAGVAPWMWALVGAALLALAAIGTVAIRRR
ncbi:MAG: copper resistance CopC family protein [Ornithinimicrobium sp.]|jgi:methionine-rich copper-binding protein CopC|uniref:copper resistance CopC family protein n=1 Tax=Ornithinimicrobium sp. TaxID=1977084 RepID=UPI003D9B0E2F